MCVCIIVGRGDNKKERREAREEEKWERRRSERELERVGVGFIVNL